MQPSISRFFTAKRPREKSNDPKNAQEVIELLSDNEKEAASAPASLAVARPPDENRHNHTDPASPVAQKESIDDDQVESDDDDRKPAAAPPMATAATAQVADPKSSASSSPSPATNPFARFAHQPKSPPKQVDLSRWVQQPNKKPRTFVSSGTEFVKICDLDDKEQAAIVKKWHSMGDRNVSMEDNRFQILIAARLHARCKEATVRTAMQQLRQAFQGELTVERMAQASPDDFSASIANLQYYPTKAKQLVQAANEIRTRYGGHVPEEEHELKKLSGIGPVLADVLAFVNTRAMHIRRRKEREQSEKDR